MQGGVFVVEIYVICQCYHDTVIMTRNIDICTRSESAAIMEKHPSEDKHVNKQKRPRSFLIAKLPFHNTCAQRMIFQKAMGEKKFILFQVIADS